MSEQQQGIFDENDTHGNDLSQAELASVDDHRWPKAMAEMVDVLSASAIRQGVAAKKEDADHLARFVVVTLGHHFGGRQIYLPKGDILDAAIRDKKIWQEFNGKNVVQLAIKYKLSEVAIYKILSQQRALHRAKVQPSLPFGEVKP